MMHTLPSEGQKIKLASVIRVLSACLCSEINNSHSSQQQSKVCQFWFVSFHICVSPTVNYLQYLATGSTLTAVEPFQLPAPQYGTLFQISSETRPSVQTVSDVCLKCICVRNTTRYINLLTYLLTLSSKSMNRLISHAQKPTNVGLIYCT